MALWVEKHHGDQGYSFINKRIAALEADNEIGGVNLWRQVAVRFAELRRGPIPIHGQPETLPN